jgi:ABC-type phosphate transport system substrate-binding protein
MPKQSTNTTFSGLLVDMNVKYRYVQLGTIARHRWRSTVVVAAGVIVALVQQAEAAGFKVVAHPSVPVASLSRTAVSAAFLKKTEKWPDGTAIVPVDQAHDSPLRQTFSQAIHERSVAMIDAFWQKQVFSGRATPPLTKAGDAEVVAYVRSNPGAIGYVSAGADSSGLKEIRLE